MWVGMRVWCVHVGVCKSVVCVRVWRVHVGVCEIVACACGCVGACMVLTDASLKDRFGTCQISLPMVCNGEDDLA